MRNSFIISAYCSQKSQSESYGLTYAFAAFIGQPFEVLRIRQVMALSNDSAHTSLGENPVNAFIKLHAKEGIQGLFRGGVPRAIMFGLIGAMA